MVIAQAQVLQRTVPAARRAVGQAYGCAKLHQRLIEIARPIRGHPCGKAFARLLFIPGIRDRCEIVIQPRGNALGTSYWRGGLTRVNERGGEIISLPSGTQIIPHDVSARMAGGPQVTVNVTVAGNVIGNRQYADELGETIVRNIIRAWDNV